MHLAYDPHERAISALLEAPSTPDSDNELVRDVITRRTTFNFHWSKQYCITSPNFLERALRLLFRLAESSDESGICRLLQRIGGVMLVLSPYFVDPLLQTLSHIFADVPLSPNSSICVISLFAFF
jgi:hypothetical protein